MKTVSRSDFFYFEPRTDANNLMIPFYCVVQKVCKKCENIDFKKEVMK